MSIVNYKTAYVPSIHGFNFGNSFSSQEILDEIPQVPSWFRHDAPWGLCGGMCFASLDRYFNKIPIPELTTSPSKGDELFKELIYRQIASVISVGWSEILHYQIRPDEGMKIKQLQLQHSLGYLTQKNQLPLITKKLAEGIPVTICLIRSRRSEIREIGENHQVVAHSYQYNSDTERITLGVYDPNHRNRDDVTIGITLGLEKSRLNASQSTGENLRGFLYMPYDRKEVYLSSDDALQYEQEGLEWLGLLL